MKVENQEIHSLTLSKLEHPPKALFIPSKSMETTDGT